MSFIKFKTLLILIVLFIVFSLLTINRHIRSQLFTYHSEIFSDKAGYYVYLPATFIYGFNGLAFPENIDSKTGNGFKLNKQHVVTKYPSGVALLQAPFWGIAHFFSSNKDGFSKIYTYAIDIAAVFYLIIGLFFSYCSFRVFATKIVSLITCAIMLLCTNLFYYGIFETGMSHIYSFAVFACILYLVLSKWNTLGEKRNLDYILIGMLAGFVFLIRSVNIVFIPIIFALGKYTFFDIKNTARQLLASKKSFFFYITFLLTIAPQIVYWIYLHVNHLQTPYTGEGFIYFMQPKIIEVLFAPENGVFLYAPILLIPFYYLLIKFKTNPIQLGAILLLLLGVIYMYASWSSYELGCALGHRSLVEFYPFAFLPVAMYLKKNKAFYLIALFVIACVVYNIKFCYSYDGCFSGDDWDWDRFIWLVLSPTK